MNEMIKSYLESAEGGNYWSHLKSAENAWSYLKSAGDSNSCGQNNLRLCLNSAESGDLAGQNNMDCGLLNNSTRLHIISEFASFLQPKFIHSTQINYLLMITLLNLFN
ncbi:hypothetical protein F8M41_012454 [Gigaspora margarita]|uniref:Uncharacterized protein n=1 Tax=Gigaspora margarita TaxID=4874 RepID=A0A8H4A1X0_GIGMA|nr:hypothetical protein F8M41_012454 [Gigaspora margarita]